MSWYYVENGQQRGPVSEEDLRALAQNGSIQPDTLVWRQGQVSWIPFNEAFKITAGAPGAAPAPALASVSEAGAAEVVCTECGRIFKADEVFHHGNSSVCAACKPAFLQRLKEGAPIASGQTFVYAGFWIRFGAKILDNIILLVLCYVFKLLVILVLSAANPIAAVVVAGLSELVILVIYDTFFIAKYGATPGKMALKLKVIQPDGSPVSYGRACGRAFAELLSGCFTLMIGYIMAGFDDEKRALHDRICGTRVIRLQ